MSISILIKPASYLCNLICKYSLQTNDYTHTLNTLFILYKNDYLNGHYTSIRLFDDYIQMLLGEAPENCGVAVICSCYFVIAVNWDAYPFDFYSIDKYFCERYYNLFEKNTKDLMAMAREIKHQLLINNN